MSVKYRIIRSAVRKTIGLQVKHGEITVRAPKYISEEYINNLVQSKTAWLHNKISEQNARPEPQRISFLDNSTLLISGEQKTLSITFAKHASTTLIEDKLIVTLPSGLKKKILNDAIMVTYVKKHLALWLNEQTQQYVEQRLKYYCIETGLAPSKVKTRIYKSRWGSCNSKGELSFNTLLAMTPNWVIDYVIVHELCHLTFLNHSQHFWALVTRYYPNYLSAKQWLKQHQNQLNWHS